MRGASLRFFMVLALGLMILVPAAAFAYSFGELNEGDWNVTWQENGIYNNGNQTFDKMEIFVITGNPWQDPALTFSAADWHFDGLPNSKYGVASGPSYKPSTQGNFIFTTFGVDPLTNPFVWDVFFWHGNSIVGAQRTTMGATYTYTELTSPYPDEKRSPVPLPASVLLLGSGLVGVGLLGSRRKQG